jgi:hypothetical protein
MVRWNSDNNTTTEGTEYLKIRAVHARIAHEREIGHGRNTEITDERKTSPFSGPCFFRVPSVAKSSFVFLDASRA